MQSMYVRYIYLNVIGKCISPVDPMGIGRIFIGSMFQARRVTRWIVVMEQSLPCGPHSQGTTTGRRRVFNWMCRGGVHVDVCQQRMKENMFSYKSNQNMKHPQFSFISTSLMDWKKLYEWTFLLRGNMLGNQQTGNISERKGWSLTPDTSKKTCS